MRTYDSLMNMVNCVDCHTYKSNRPGKHAGISLFNVTARTSEFYVKRRKEVLNIIAKHRIVNADLKHRIKNGSIYFCENHYKAEDIELTRKLY